ncbi:triosephosphate isomerase [Alphaproteobacteria bacterium]|nr:triosephosphate isomerase [Alphaproteobacteria bacterium]
MKYIIGNWKMNGDFDKVDQWLNSYLDLYNKNYDNLSKKTLVVCPPNVFIDYIDTELMEDGFSFLEKFAQKNGRKIEDFSVDEFNEIIFSSRAIKIGAQDCGFAENGAFTGDISAKMLKDIGCEYVIVGHSERRKYYYESNEIIAKKLKNAIGFKINPILCVGENSDIRASKDYLQFIEKQLCQSLNTEDKIEKILIAYEPIWAIGSGNNASSSQIAEVTKFIKEFIANNFKNIKEALIIYGGSVTSKNSGEILKIDHIDGLLVGGASLDVNEFVNIACS